MSDIPVNPKVSRRLAAILAADIAGYSTLMGATLMGADGARTVRNLKAHQAVVLPMITQLGGASSTPRGTAFSRSSGAS